MSRIGVTGHMDLTADVANLIEVAIRHALAAHVGTDLIGVSCIAAGADSIFARAVLDLHGRLEVIIPAADYRTTKVTAEHAPVFDDLLHRADKVTIMPYDTANRDAYQAANETLLGSSDQLFAIWDGQDPGDNGGTGQVVRSAQNRGMPVTIIWPDGAQRRG
jgi:hypothetical protein